jgi:hypothetical protein
MGVIVRVIVRVIVAVVVVVVVVVESVRASIVVVVLLAMAVLAMIMIVLVAVPGGVAGARVVLFHRSYLTSDAAFSSGRRPHRRRGIVGALWRHAVRAALLCTISLTNQSLTIWSPGLDRHVTNSAAAKVAGQRTAAGRPPHSPRSVRDG